MKKLFQSFFNTLNNIFEIQMDNSPLLERLFNLNASMGMKFGLRNMQNLQQIFDFPDRKFASIHVAGTNGKGSVCTKIAAAFTQAGYKTGLYTSPHLSSFCERIQIDGKMIPEKTVNDMLSELFKLLDEKCVQATFFELTTCLAFNYFASQNIDIAIIETGLGGRLDATNVVIPLLSIITSIGFDHTEILGTTLEEITREKAGIIKPNIPVVIGPSVPLPIIQSFCSKMNSKCYQLDQIFENFEEENQAIARKALQILSKDFRLTEKIIEKAIEKKPPNRLEIIEGTPLIILDVAHNPDGLKALFKAIHQKFLNSPLRILFGLSKNKDIESCLQLIEDAGDHFHLIKAKGERGLDVPILSTLLQKKISRGQKIYEHELISEGFNQAKNQAAKSGEILVICGSFFIMSEIRNLLGMGENIDAISLNEDSKYTIEESQ